MTKVKLKDTIHRQQGTISYLVGELQAMKLAHVGDPTLQLEQAHREIAELTKQVLEGAKPSTLGVDTLKLEVAAKTSAIAVLSEELREARTTIRDLNYKLNPRTEEECDEGCCGDGCCCDH